jgi:phosphatidylserine decarboxylase
MTTLEEYTQFFNQFSGDSIGVSAVVPTSPCAAREMASEMARRTGPRRVLEVGSGTGSIAAEVAQLLRPDDELWLCEFNDDFIQFLHERVATDSAFETVRENVHIFSGSILELPNEATERQFDFIISSLPFNSFPGEFVQQVFDLYHKILKPAGSLSYIEYMGGRALKKLLSPDEAVSESNAITEGQMERYEIRKAPVLLNIPPAWIHHLRLSEAKPEDAQQIINIPRDQIQAGDMTFDWDALLFVGPLLAWAFMRKRLWPALLAVPIALFFRDPKRNTERNEIDILAAGDGEVLEIATVQEDELGEGEWLRIAVFLSITDVHVNRSPVSGRVQKVWHKQGRFEVASTPEAVHNESVYTLIESLNGPVAVAQRVGAVARRVVNRTRSNALLVQGEKYGLMRFGSRIDVYIPAGKAEALVQVGQKVVGGETVLARYVHQVK